MMPSSATAMFVATAAAVVVVVRLCGGTAGRSKSSSSLAGSKDYDSSYCDDDNDDDDDEDDAIADHYDRRLPSHVRRELHKTKRRQLLQKWLTMKKPMYDNVILQCNQSTVLGTISLKKAHWYVQKGLAEWTTNNAPPPANNNDKNNNDDYDDDNASAEPTATMATTTTTMTTLSIRLNFTPAGRARDSLARTYQTAMKHNRCVVCGDHHEGYARHYIVPYTYRTLLPKIYKNHLPHDIVILCPDCHIMAEQQSHRRKKILEEAAVQAHVRMATQPEGSSSSSAAAAALLRRPFLVDSDLRAVKRAAATLLQHHQGQNDQNKNTKKKHPPKLPVARIHALQTTIRTSDWFARNVHHDDQRKQSDADDALLRPLSDEILRAAVALEDEIPNPNYIGPAELVVASLIMDDRDDIAAFVKAWRTHFVTTMDPRFLPTGWSVDAAVTSDVRTNDD